MEAQLLASRLGGAGTAAAAAVAARAARASRCCGPLISSTTAGRIATAGGAAAVSSPLAVTGILTARRHKSTANRTKRALNIAPHPSFLPPTAATSSSSSSSSTSMAGGGVTHQFIYNPPASQASVYHTPFKFLPKTDPRRRAGLTEHLFAARSSPALQPFSSTTTSSSPSSSTTSSTSPATASASASASTTTPPASTLPPKLETETKQYSKYHLTADDVAELRRLRAQDPLEWSVHRLAERFNCSPIFVMLAVRASREHREAARERLARVRARWGPIRTKARTERRKRVEMLYAGEL